MANQTTESLVPSLSHQIELRLGLMWFVATLIVQVSIVTQARNSKGVSCSMLGSCKAHANLSFKVT